MIWVGQEWQEERHKLCGVKLTRTYANLKRPLEIQGFGLGIDPGRNFGISFVAPLFVEIIHGNLHHDRDWTYMDDGEMAYQMAQQYKAPMTGELKACIEGAAHSSHVGQANLAYIRFGFYLGLSNRGIEVYMAPPNTIRKGVTGHGNTPMWELLPNMNENAADALGCALYAAGYIEV
jgi:hypothetical protein